MQVTLNKQRIHSENFEYYSNLPKGVTPGLAVREDKGTTIKQVSFYLAGDWFKTENLCLGLPLSKSELSKQGLSKVFNGNTYLIPPRIEIFNESHLRELSKIFPLEELKEIKEFEIGLRKEFGDLYRFRR